MISVTIVVKNGQRRLREVLSALSRFDEVLLLDTGSIDETLDIARAYPNVTIHRSPFEGFGPAHNRAAALARYSWILSIDADEVISDTLADELFSLQLHPTSVYSLPFQNYFNHKHIKWCGWHPESHVRLYNREVTRFSDAMVHEGILTKGLDVVKLQGPVRHYSYDTISDFLRKMEEYSTLFADEYQHRKKSSPLIAIYHGLGAFLKSYLLKRGFLGGYEGYLISAYNGHTAFYKYLKLYLANAHRLSLPQDRQREIRKLP